MRKKEIKEKKSKKQKAANARQKQGGDSFFSRAVAFSLILHIIDVITNAVYSCLSNGFFGRIFTAYSAEQRAFENGYVRNYLYRRPSAILRKISARISDSFERSYLLDKFTAFAKGFLTTSLKIYGNFALSLGVYSLLAFFGKLILTNFAYTEFDTVVFGILMILVSLPLLASSVSLGEAVCNSRIIGALVKDAFGFKEEGLLVEAEKSKKRSNLAIISGMILGLLTFFVDAVYFAVFFAVFLLSMLILASPEIGVMLSLFAIPFVSVFSTPSLILAAIVACTAVGYIIKLVRGKRLLKIEILDFFVIIFGIILFMSGIISAGGRSSLAEASLCVVLLLGYFVTVNLIRTEKWISRCVNAIIAPGVITAAIGIMQYIFGTVSNSWLDLSYFGNIKGRAVSLFDNPNILATYLVIVLPFALYRLFSAKSFSGKLLALLSTATVVACIALTFSRSAWIASIVIVILFGLINSKNTFKAILGACFVLPFLPFVLPQNLIRRFMSIGDISESSNFYRLYTWKGTFGAIGDNLFGGVGFGNEAFAQIYPSYAYAGIEAAAHSHSLYLQIIFSIGLFGFLIFAVFMFMFAQKNFEYYNRSKQSVTRGVASAAMCAVTGILVIGLFDYPWYNNRMFFLFFAMMALSCACIRCGDREREREKTFNVSSTVSASIDL